MSTPESKKFLMRFSADNPPKLSLEKVLERFPSVKLLPKEQDKKTYVEIPSTEATDIVDQIRDTGWHVYPS